MAAIHMAPQYKPIVWNRTPSMPEGFYVRSFGEAPAVGKIIAFPAPPSVVDYAQKQGATGNLPWLIKPLAAGVGDHVCVTDHLTINGQTIAPVFDTAPDGMPLPRWRECRVLADGEWFAYAPRRPDSLDSRYYGPVRDADVIGVFLAVWTD